MSVLDGRRGTTAGRLRWPLVVRLVNPFIWAFTLMLLLVCVGVVLIAGFDGTGEEVGRELLPASIVGLAVAIVAAVLDGHNESRAAAEAVRGRVLSALVAARDRLEIANLVVSANHSVDSYGQQIIEIVHAQGALRHARSLVQATDPQERVLDVRHLATLLREVYEFLGQVTQEYQEEWTNVENASKMSGEDEWPALESLPQLRRFLDPATFENEVRVKLRAAVKSVQVSSGGVRSMTATTSGDMNTIPSRYEP
jgi:hypothetical protein